MATWCGRVLIFSLSALAGAGCRDTSGGSVSPVEQGRPARYTPTTRIYYVAAEDVDWNYAPLDSDPVFGRPLPEPWGVQTVYAKQRYVQYTDGTFTTTVPQPAWQGILGPMIRGVVGDTIKVVFHNKTGMPFSIHPHGVRYDRPDEGAFYNPPRGGGDAVAGGGTYTYTWFVRPEAGPLPGEPSSKVWLYHSHVDADEDIYRGLIGTIVITDPAHAREDGSPDDVGREFTTLWMVFNEAHEGAPEDSVEPHLKHSINGYFFGNLPGLAMNQGDRVRWYVLSRGRSHDGRDVHPVHDRGRHSARGAGRARSGPRLVGFSRPRKRDGAPVSVMPRPLAPRRRSPPAARPHPRPSVRSSRRAAPARGRGPLGSPARGAGPGLLEACRAW